VVNVTATLHYIKDGRAEYDDICLLNLRTEKDFVGRVVQDVVTKPVKKIAWIQGKNGSLQWVNGYDSKGDAIILSLANKSVPEVISCPKTRPDDFIEELKHIESCLESGKESEISLKRGLDTMLVVSATHLSEKEKKTVKINYDRGYTSEALSI